MNKCRLAKAFLRAQQIIIYLIFITPAQASDSVDLQLDQILAKGWQLNEISLSLSDLQKSPQQLSLLIGKLSLPPPFSDLQIVDIQCHKFTWQQSIIDCEQGNAKIKSKKFHSPHFLFSFSLTEQKSWFSIKNLKLAKGIISLIAKEEGYKWTISITAKNLSLKALKAYLPKPETIKIDKGQLSAEIKLMGKGEQVNSYLMKALFKQLTLQVNHGKVATELVELQWDLQAKLKQGKWQWENTAKIKQGEVYLEPIYLVIKNKTLTLKAKGKRLQKGQIQLQSINYVHPDVINLQANGLIRDLFNLKIEYASVSTEINNLNYFSKQYISPFVEQTAFEGFNFDGKIYVEANVSQSKLTDLSADLHHLNVTDNNNRFGMKNVKGTINWSNNSMFKKASTIYWDQLNIRAIPINASELKFLFKNKQLTLLEEASIPLLGGNVYIKDFNWQNMMEDQPKVYFEGEIQQLSLEKLSYALDWTPLTGNISGFIPGVHYENKTLTVKGELLAKLFDGTVKINNLSSSGLFTDFSKFSMDMQIENLDLYLLTQKFEIGVMEGRVSGFVTDLYLENWQPISFYAWLGTPENDKSRHRVSQKAVENIASIGGGGAADIISKGFLRFFDTFHYDRLGFGCYLHQGVCQLMGVEAAEQGYYLVKGGWLPRIDIKGYNTQLDWNVLVDRLSRIAATDDVIVE